MESINLTLLVSLLCAFISTITSILLVENIKKDKVILVFGIIQPTINFFSVIVFINIFGMGIKPIFYTMVIVQTCFSTMLYSSLKKTIPVVYYEMTEEVGGNKYSTFIWPVYKNKIKKIFITNFIMVYNEYFITKFMALETNLVQSELVFKYSRILFEGYKPFYILLTISLIPVLISIKILYQD